MSHSNILLVPSPYLDYASWLSKGVTPRLSPYIPLGLLSLASSLRNCGNKVSLFDVNDFLNDCFLPDKSLDEIYLLVAKEIIKKNPDIVGFSTDYYTYHHIIQISKFIKKLKNNCVIIFGGPQASACDVETMNSFEVPDFIIRGESEISFPELVDTIEKNSNWDNVAGITYRNNGKPSQTKPRTLISNLDDLPYPAFDLVDIQKRDLVNIEAGRGCPFACTFCSTSDFWIRMYRMKSANRICDEIEFLQKNYEIENVSLVHDCLTADHKPVIELCETMDQRKLQVKWGCSSRTDTINPKLIRRMAASGCRHLYFGLESGSKEIQKLINKNLDLEQAFEIVKSARKSGIEVTTPFMVGFPKETKKQIAQTFETIYRALACDVYLVQIFVVAPYGDTPLLGDNSNMVSFDGHFLDLALKDSDVVKRNKMMKYNKGVFSGHYRYKSIYDQKLVRGADQFFPLMNEMRYTALTIWKETGDSMYLYEKWVQWLNENENDDSYLRNTKSYGSFQSFGKFLNELSSKMKNDIPYIEELIDFEQTRLDALAIGMETPCDIYNPNLTKIFDSKTYLKCLPNVIVKTYEHNIPKIIQDLQTNVKPNPEPMNGGLAIVGFNERNVEVLQLNSFTTELLAYCKQGFQIEDMVYRIKRRYMQSNISFNDKEISELCIKALHELQKMKLVRGRE